MGQAYTNEELQIARMSREYTGEIMAVGSTPLADLATKVAKLVHNPDVVINGGGSWAAWDSRVTPGTRHDEFIGRTDPSEASQIDALARTDLTRGDASAKQAAPRSDGKQDQTGSTATSAKQAAAWL